MVDERDGRDPGEDRRGAEQLGREIDPRRQPGEDEVKRRRDLRIRVHGRDHAAQAVPGDDRVRGQLVGEQAVVQDHQPQPGADHRDGGHDGRGVERVPRAVMVVALFIKLRACDVRACRAGRKP